MSDRAWAIERVIAEPDLDPVLEIEQLCFVSPWTREMYVRELANTRGSHIYVLRVRPDGGASAVAGFCAFWLVADELHVNNLAVRPEYRRQGVATALLRDALVTGVRLGARRATLEVRRSNEDAQRVYRRLGFAVAGVRPRYYTGPVEDALILWHPDLPACTAAP